MVLGEKQKKKNREVEKENMREKKKFNKRIEKGRN